MDYRDNRKHRALHQTNWPLFTPAPWPKFAPALTPLAGIFITEATINHKVTSNLERYPFGR